MATKLGDAEVSRRVQAWLEGPFDEATKGEIRRLLREDQKGLADAFFKDLSFGTGGMRGIMGVGTNRMNVYTIRTATQGLANYLKKQPSRGKEPSAFIGYDVRLHSKEFAKEVASVFAGNGIHALLSKEVCATPLVSFACRYFDCDAAVMITASHNPPQYNGYKVYWRGGGQVVPPHDTGIMEEAEKVEAISLAPLEPPWVNWVGDELDEAYLKELSKMQLHPELKGTSLKIIYSNLHGTGLRLIPRALKEWGYSSVALVEKQASLDGNFPFAHSPNPEEKEAMALGIEQLLREEADLFIATDPDADRVGVAIRKGKKEVRFTGNQMSCLLLYHICSALAAKKEFPPNGACIKTIVTTELFKKIGESFGAACIDVLTGFKYIGEKIEEWENSFGGYQFLFGAEESYGYLFGTFVRDKDASSASCFIAEIAALAKQENQTLLDRLYQLYQKYGIHRESLTNLAFSESKSGMQKMQSLMQHLRQRTPSQISGQKVVKVEDYLEGNLPLPRSDVLRFWLSDESKLVIRPSGTEPKVKIYAEVVGKGDGDLENAIAACDERLEVLMETFRKEIGGFFPQ